METHVRSLDLRLLIPFLTLSQLSPAGTNLPILRNHPHLSLLVTRLAPLSKAYGVHLEGRFPLSWCSLSTHVYLQSNGRSANPILIVELRNLVNAGVPLPWSDRCFQEFGGSYDLYAPKRVEKEQVGIAGHDVGRIAVDG